MDLLKHGIPTWPTQLRRYFPHVMQDVPPPNDYNMPPTKIDDFSLVGSKHSGWEALMHPSGLLYYYKPAKRTFTPVDIVSCSQEQLRNFEEWIDASRACIAHHDTNDTWTLVAQPVRLEEDLHDRYEYYYAVEDRHIITWHHTFDALILFQECAILRGWDHKRQELEAQFWKHVEYFPHTFTLKCSDIVKLRMKLNWLHAEAVAVGQSTAMSTFGSLDELNEFLSILAVICELNEHSDRVDKSGVAVYARVQHILYHHYFLHLYGRPEVRLLRSHSIGPTKKRNNILVAWLIAAGTMLGIPSLVVNRLENFYVNGIVNSTDIKSFVDDLTGQIGWQMTVAGVIMAVDSAILAIPIIGAVATTKWLCACSLIFAAGCVLSGIVTQHFGTRLVSSIEFAEYALSSSVLASATLYSMPGLFCTISASLAVCGFLAGIFLDTTRTLLVIIMTSISLAIVVCSLGLAALVGFRPDLIYDCDRRNLLV